MNKDGLPAPNKDKPRTFRPRRRPNSYYQKMYLTFDRDPTVQTYFEGIKGRRRNRGYLSQSTSTLAHQSMRRFLDYLEIPVSDHAFKDLVTERRNDPSSHWIDDKLLTFSNMNPISSYRNFATYIKGLFTRNGVKLAPKIDNHFAKRTPKISDGILKEIFEGQDFETQTLMELQAYSGERVRCIAQRIKLSQIRLYDDKYATITIEHWQTKARIPHICVIPRRVAEAVFSIAKQTGRDCPFPNFDSLWRQITKYALDKHGARLTSHYLRKRFHTIAQKTAMPVNHWDHLMGDSMKEGHEAETYTLDDDTEIIQEYDRFLAPRLSLCDPQDDFLTSPATGSREISSLVKTIEELTLQVSALLKENKALREQPVQKSD